MLPSLFYPLKTSESQGSSIEWKGTLAGNGLINCTVQIGVKWY